VMDLWAYTNGVILDFSRRGKPTGQRGHRILQRPFPRRVSERALVSIVGGCDDEDRRLATGLQCESSSPSSQGAEPRRIRSASDHRGRGLTLGVVRKSRSPQSAILSSFNWSENRRARQIASRATRTRRRSCSPTSRCSITSGAVTRHWARSAPRSWSVEPPRQHGQSIHQIGSRPPSSGAFNACRFASTRMSGADAVACRADWARSRRQRRGSGRLT
jgi:hypothetical protein